MIVNNNVKFGFNVAFEITSADKETTKFELPEDRFTELKGSALPGIPPYTVEAVGGCGSATLTGIGADDVVTYYQGWDKQTGHGKTTLGASSDIR